jgi:hypothetical protein
MAAARLIVCEKSSRWAVAFRRALGRRHRVVAESRSLADCRRQLAEHSGSVAALETTTTNLEAVLKQLPAWSREFPSARFLVLADRELVAAEPLLREAGALEVLLSTSDVARAAKPALRRLALAAPERLSWREAIESRLPWAAWATPRG